MSDLKRCPFCGDEVEIRPTGLYHWRYAIHHKTKTECILDTTGMAVPHERDEAIRLWNERSADRPQGYWTKTDVATYRCSKCGKKQIADDENELNYCCCCGSHNKIRRLKGDHNE